MDVDAGPNPALVRAESKKAIQVIASRLDNRMQLETKDELRVARSNFMIAKKRGAIGLFTGAAASGLAWHALVGKQRSMMLAVISGAVAGMSYGMFSVRQKMFMEMLSLPDDKSPFAKRAHAILEKEMPGSILHAEFRRRRAVMDPWSDESEQEIWTEPLPSPSRAPEDIYKPRSSDPFITHKPQTDEGDAFEERDQCRSSTDYTKKQQPFWWTENSNDDEHYDDPAGRTRLTTWEEIRRRAGGRG